MGKGRKTAAEPVTTKAEHTESATQAATRDATTWLLKHPVPTSSQDKAQPKCPRSSVIVSLAKHFTPVYVTDQQHALQWADWCSNLPEGIPELYKLHKRWEEEEVRKEVRKQRSVKMMATKLMMKKRATF